MLSKILLLFAIAHLSLIECSKLVVKGTDIEGVIAAFADFDSNRFTDVFTITENGHSLRLVRSDEKGFEGEYWPGVACNYSDEYIVDVIPGDFSGHGQMDVMLVTKPLKMNTNSFNIYILEGDRDKLNCPEKPLIDNAESHPLILDYNGDMIADFIIQTHNCSTQLWSLVLPESSNVNNNHYNVECLKKEGRMRFPHSNAFVNLLNCPDRSLDYSTDLFFSYEDTMEYWINRRGFFEKDRVKIPYPDEKRYRLGQSIFVDLKKNGCTQHIMAACEITGASKCNPQILWFDYNKKEWQEISDFREGDNKTNVLFDDINTDYVTFPMTVRAGDFDIDGYVDLIAVMKDAHSELHKVVILKNVPSQRTSMRREFQLDWTSDSMFARDGDDVVLGSFLDVEENGKLDIVMTIKEKATGKHKLKWIQNQLKEYSCFLKMLVVTGLCYDKCPNERVPYGTNQAGSFVCYETVDMDGKNIKSCNTQLSQSAHFALQTPYSVFGLGETPNFVDKIFASIPTPGDRAVRKSRWTQIVPDAQVLIIPYPPNETDSWICKLFYTPSSIIFSTLITLASMCGILIVIICFLHRKEVLEDLTEHEEYKRHWPESR